MVALARRICTMSRDELAWRLRSRLRIHAAEAACAVRSPRWDRADIRRALAIETLAPELQAAVSGGNWQAVHDGVRETIRQRPSRFVLNPAAMPDVRREIALRWPGASADAARRATAIALGSFDLLGYRGLSFDSKASGGIDWHFDPVHQRRMPMAFWSRVPYLDAACGDHKVVWELNRQQHWLTLSRALWLTGDRFWAREMVRELPAWMAANPPLLGANWASMLELAFRSMSWLWGMHATLAFDEPDHCEEPWLVDVLVALDRQLTHVEQNLSIYFSPNTHLTGEALALYVAGAALPELAGSTRWVDTGRRVLLAEIDRQIEADGGHAERSTHYHRYTLDFYLLALQTARRIGDVDAEQRFREALERVVPFARAMADGRGRLPLIGDDDAGRLWPIAGRAVVDIRDSLGLAAAVLDRADWAPWGATEEVLWLTAGDREAFARALRMDVEERRLGERRTLSFRASVRQASQPTSHSVLAFANRERRSTAERRGRPAPLSENVTPTVAPDERTTAVFPATGFVTSATGAGDHLVVDVGPHGYLNGGHAHADALSVVLTLRGLPLLVDPGTPTYTMDGALRDQLRSSVNHNTVTVDGASSAIPRGPFHWQSRADARLEVVRRNARFMLVEASHDAYREVGHRRLVLAGERGYLLVDDLDGNGSHEVSQHWHFDPAWKVTGDSSQSLCLNHESGTSACLLSERGEVRLFNGDEPSSLGWFSPAYGVRIPSWTARVTHAMTGRLMLVTWCGIVRPGEVPALERIACESDPAHPAVAVRMAGDVAEWITVLRPGDPIGRANRTAVAAGIQTDARALQTTFDGAGLLSLSLADGRYACVRGGLTVLADAVVDDLHIARIGDRLEVTSTAPPPTLRIHGAVLGTVARVVANDTELRRSGATGDGVALSASEWGTFRLTDENSGSQRCAG